MTDTTVRFTYRNHRNEVSERTVQPFSLDYMALPNNEFKHSPGWFLTGLDYTGGREGVARSFELASIQLPEKEFLNAKFGPVYRIPLPVEPLARKVEALEELRPIWAEGWSSDSIAAQASATALAQLWKMLKASNQTEAVHKLQLILDHIAEARDNALKGF